MADEYRIDGGRPDELAKLQRIESTAAALFPETLLPAEMRGGVTPLGDLRAGLRSGWLRVARASSNEPVGFALAERRGGRLHLHEMDVLPAYGRRGIGAALLASIVEAARAAALDEVTLTTFALLPWNAPFYARHGFETIAEDALDTELARILDAEARAGIDPATRVAMRCRLSQPAD